MRDGSDVAGVPKQKVGKFKRLLTWLGDWLDERNNYGHKRGELITGYFWLAVVLLAMGTAIYWINEWDRRGREERCEGIYATSTCLERLLKEVRLKEEYEAKLKEVK